MVWKAKETNEHFLIAPSILSADFARLGAEVVDVLAAGADVVHFDVMGRFFLLALMCATWACTHKQTCTILALYSYHHNMHSLHTDNHYVPNLTIGPMVCKALRDHGVTKDIDVHLMVQPGKRDLLYTCLLYTSPSPRDRTRSRMPSSA